MTRAGAPFVLPLRQTNKAIIPIPLQLQKVSAAWKAVNGAMLLVLLAPRSAVAVDPPQSIELSGRYFDISQVDTAPRALSNIRPHYPTECRRTGITGTVMVDFVVKPDGTTAVVRAIASPDERLSQAAVAAVSKWSFAPGFKKGVAVFTHLQVPINFELNISSPAGGMSLETVKPDHPPVIAFAAAPQYPPEFAAKQVEGEVLIKFIVCPDGTTTDVLAIHSSDKRLDSFAVKAVLRWRFKPGTKAGSPVYCAMEVPVEFKATRPKEDAPSDTAFNPVTDSEIPLAKGAAALKANSYAEAVDAFAAAIRSSPDSASGYLGRARAYAGLGREDEAMDDYARAASLDAADNAALEAFRRGLPDTPDRRWASLRYATFNEIWRTVNESYFDPTFGGVSWIGMREKYRPLLSGVADNGQLIALMQQMLGELRRTHFTLIPRAAAVFNPSERVRIGTAGIDVAWIEDSVVVRQVTADSKGAKALLTPGDQITKIDEVDLASLEDMLSKAGVGPSRSHLYLTQLVESRLSAAVGTKVRLEAIAPGSVAREVTATCGITELPWSEPLGYFPSTPIRCTTERGQDGIGVFRFNVFVPPVMKHYREFERSLAPGDGLIIDLRGNSGGLTVMASGICGWLCRDEFVLASMHQRTGSTEMEVYPQAHAFAGPVAILIDGQSASTSEVLAAGLKEHHRARVFGVPSAGAALPSLFKTLPNGDLFQYAVADIKTPSGTQIEGNGVEPDEIVHVTRADLAAGRDPVEEAARRWIAASHQALETATAAAGG
jgi:carboxyl-terminal processing protease